jgi:hypothetical protein
MGIPFVALADVAVPEVARSIRGGVASLLALRAQDVTVSSIVDLATAQVLVVGASDEINGDSDSDSESESTRTIRSNVDEAKARGLQGNGAGVDINMAAAVNEVTSTAAAVELRRIDQLLRSVPAGALAAALTPSLTLLSAITGIPLSALVPVVNVSAIVVDTGQTSPSPSVQIGADASGSVLATAVPAGVGVAAAVVAIVALAVVRAKRHSARKSAVVAPMPEDELNAAHSAKPSEPAARAATVAEATAAGADAECCEQSATSDIDRGPPVPRVAWEEQSNTENAAADPLAEIMEELAGDIDDDADAVPVWSLRR